MKINKTELFKEAHKMAKRIGGDYRQNFPQCLKKLYRESKQLRLKNIVDDKFYISTAQVGDVYETMVFRADGSYDVWDFGNPLFEHTTKDKNEAIKVHNEQYNWYFDLVLLFTFV